MSHFTLLALCCRAQTDTIDGRLLTQEANKITDWSQVPTQAEWHGLGPLLYTGLKAADIEPPQNIKRDLQGLYLRHRHANGVRARVLAEILAAYQTAGIQALVIKGAALAHLLYPEPALRPMSDIDLLVKKSDARRGQELLAELGFHAPLPPSDRLPGKHLLAATRLVEGLAVSVELHHNLFNFGTRASLELEKLTAPPIPFALAGVTAYTLPYEEILWHQCQHLALIGQPFRLIWLADIVGLAERFAGEIDWDRVDQDYPLALSTLSLFHFIAPLSETLLGLAPLRIGRIPPGIGRPFEGWPSASIKRLRAAGKGYGRIIGDTFWPSEWWLRLYYGLGSARPLFWHRWVVHPAQVLRWGGRLFLERIGWRQPFHELEIGV
jgi:hypothetical protein